jgi:hypothetical protein
VRTCARYNNLYEIIASRYLYLLLIVPTTEAAIKTVNNIGKQESQPEGIEFSDLNGRITLQDFAENDNDEDSNASDDDFKIDEEYQDEEKNEIVLEEEEGAIGNDGPKSQEDYFQNPSTTAQH